MADRYDLRSKTCCFTGHQDLEPWDWPKVQARLKWQMWPLISDGVLYFSVGGARGFDMLAAEFMLDTRDTAQNKLRIISVLPLPDYRADWLEEDFRRQQEIIRRSDKVVYVSRENEKGAYFARNRKLVDGSAYCISYCRRLTGGTAYTVRYAMKQGILVFNTSSWDLRQLASK